MDFELIIVEVMHNNRSKSFIASEIPEASKPKSRIYRTERNEKN